MSLVLFVGLFLVLLFSALKLSLVEQTWEVIPSALLVATSPLLFHAYAVRASMLQVHALLTTREALANLSTLLAIEALLSMLLILSIVLVHAYASSASSKRILQTQGIGYGFALAGCGLTILAGRILGSLVFLVIGIVLIAAVLLWPWLPVQLHEALKQGAPKGLSSRLTVLFFAPLWALLSPVGLVVMLAMHMHLLHNTAGTGLGGLTLFYSGGIFASLSVSTFLLRLLLPHWRLRLNGVILLAFLLLVMAMFLPFLFSTVPPPTSTIHLNWPATLSFGLLVGLVFAVSAYYRHRNYAMTS